MNLCFDMLDTTLLYSDMSNSGAILQGSRSQPQDQSETEDTPLVQLHAATCDTASSQRNEFHRDMGASTSTGRSGNPSVLTGVMVQNSMLMDAVLNRNLEDVKRLLAEGASPSFMQGDTTILHKCIANYSGSYLVPDQDQNKLETEIKIIKELLIIARESDSVDMVNGYKQTPLCCVIKMYGDLEIIKALVSAGARLHNIGGDGETAMHAALQSSHNRKEVVEFLLDITDNNFPYLPDNSGSTPLHRAAKNGDVEIMKQLLIRNIKVIKLKKESEEITKPIEKIPVHGQGIETVEGFINALNNDGETPVLLAACYGHVDMTRFLLHNGAALSVRGERDSVIKQILLNFNHPYAFLENILDDNIFYWGSWIPVSYNVLGSRNRGNQLKCVEDLVKYGFTKLLKHPLIESLIYIKWECIRALFTTIWISYLIFLFLFNAFIITAFYKIDAARRASNSSVHNNDTTPVPNLNESCMGGGHYAWYPLIYILIIVLSAQEVIWWYLQKRRYFKRWESYVTIGALLLGSVVPLALACPAPWPAVWQRHLACAALLLAWLRPLFLMSRCSGWGHYVLMFQTVAINISKIFAVFICLLIGFALCFMIQYQLEDPFNNPGVAIIKTLVMLSSEFDYGDLFTDKIDEYVATAVIVRLLFVVFVIFMATVLMNLMIGVAVSDINELTRLGAVKALEMQVEFLNGLDGAENTFLTKVFKKLLHLRHHYYIMSHNPSSYMKWEVNLRQSRYDVVLPKELHNDIQKNAKQETQFKCIELISEAIRKSVITPIPQPKTFEERISSIENDLKGIIQSDELSRHSINDLKINIQKVLDILSIKSSVKRVRRTTA